MRGYVKDIFSGYWRLRFHTPLPLFDDTSTILLLSFFSLAFGLSWFSSSYNITRLTP